MPQEHLIRESRNAQEIAGLHAAQLTELGKTYSEQQIVDQWQRVPNALFLIAERNQPVGFLAYRLFNESSGYISDLFVDKLHRRQGLALALLQHLQNKQLTLELHVEYENDTAYALYLTRQFQFVSNQAGRKLLRWHPKVSDPSKDRTCTIG